MLNWMGVFVKKVDKKEIQIVSSMVKSKGKCSSAVDFLVKNQLKHRSAMSSKVLHNFAWLGCNSKPGF